MRLKFRRKRVAMLFQRIAAYIRLGDLFEVVGKTDETGTFMSFSTFSSAGSS